MRSRDLPAALDAFLESGARHCLVRRAGGAVLGAWSSDLASRGGIDVAYVVIGHGASALESDVMAALVGALHAAVGVDAVVHDDTQSIRAAVARCLREDHERPLVVALDGIDAAAGWAVDQHPFYWRQGLELFRETGAGVRVVLSTSDPDDDGSRAFGTPATCLSLDAPGWTSTDDVHLAWLAVAAGPIRRNELRAWIGDVPTDGSVVGENEHGLFLRDRRVVPKLEQEAPEALARARTRLRDVCASAAHATEPPSPYPLRHAFVHLHRDAALTERRWLARRRTLRECLDDLRTVRTQCHGDEGTLAPLQVRCALLEATLVTLADEGVVDFDRALGDAGVVARFVTAAANLVPAMAARILTCAQPVAERAFDLDPVPLARIAPEAAFVRLQAAPPSQAANAGRAALLGLVSAERARELARVLFASMDEDVLSLVEERICAIDQATADVLWTESARLGPYHRRSIASEVAPRTSFPDAVSVALSLVLAGTAEGEYAQQRNVHAMLCRLVPHLEVGDLARLSTAAEEMQHDGGRHFPDGSPIEWGRELARLVAERRGAARRPWQPETTLRQVASGDLQLLERRAHDLVAVLGPGPLIALARSFDGDRGHRARLAVAGAASGEVREALVAEAFARFRADTPAHLDSGVDFVAVADALSLDDASYLFSALLGHVTEGADSRRSLLEGELPGSLADVLPLVARFGDEVFAAVVEEVVRAADEFP